MSAISPDKSSLPASAYVVVKGTMCRHQTNGSQSAPHAVAFAHELIQTGLQCRHEDFVSGNMESLKFLSKLGLNHTLSLRSRSMNGGRYRELSPSAQIRI